MGLPDQRAPLLGSAAVSGVAEAAAWVGADVCSDDRMPLLPVPPNSCPSDPNELSELPGFLKCPVPQSLELDTQDQPPMLSAPHSQAE